MTLRERISALYASGEVDPHRIADLLATDLPSRDLRAALRESLPATCRQVVHHQRMRTALTPAPDATRGRNETHSSAASGANHSSRWQTATDAWQATLAIPYYVAGEWKRLADLSATPPANHHPPEAHPLSDGGRVAAKRRKGQKANWNATAKMRAHLIAESCMKQRTSPYRAVYDDARANWADRPTSDLHKHNHALRLTAKAMLADLYSAAREVHEGVAA